MVKTCELQTCDGKHTVELQDILFSPDSKTIKKVSGETILKLPIDLNSISKKLTFLEDVIHNISDENIYKEIEIEINKIRELINKMENDFQVINEKLLNDESQINYLKSTIVDKDTFNKFINSFSEWKEEVNSQLNLIKSIIDTNKNDIISLKNDLNKINTQINTIINDFDNFKKSYMTEVENYFKENYLPLIISVINRITVLEDEIINKGVLDG
jgi:predicted  nucleic acid-binding Zn-ribbon protein